MHIFVEGEPQGKARPRVVRGHAYTPQKTRDYERLIASTFKQAAFREGFKPINGPVELTIIARFPVPKSYSKKRREACLRGCEQPTKKPDFDNIAKACGDSLNGLAYDDDSQIVKSTITKIYHQIPGIDVFITSYKPDDS